MQRPFVGQLSVNRSNRRFMAFGHHLFIGPLLLIIAVIFAKFPPAGINHWYGYRTPTSMRNKDVWDEANRYSARLLLVVAVLQTLVEFLCLTLSPGPMTYTIPAVSVTTGIVLLIVLTEIHLGKLFDAYGRRR